MTYHDKVKLRRKELGWTLAVASKNIGISVSTLSAVESGRIKSVNLTLISLIVKGLDTTYGYLFDKEEDMSNFTQLKQYLNHLDEEDIEILEEMARLLVDRKSRRHGTN